jgi:hypothetical protein
MAAVSKFIGVEKFKAQLRRREAVTGAAWEKGLASAGIWLLQASQNIVPVMTGLLRSTGQIRLEGREFRTEIVVSYGTDYSVYVHEDLTKAHGRDFNAKYAREIAAAKPNDPYFFKRKAREQAKFLEQPLRRGKRRMANILNREVRANILQSHPKRPTK